MNIKKLSLTALLAALTFSATIIIRIPSFSGGYINLGDMLVLISGYLLGPVGALAAGIGSLFADLSAGFFIYAPATFIIKGLMALVGYCIAVKGFNFKKIGLLIGGLVAELVMVFGYFIFECFLYGAAGAAINIIPNLIQGAVGAISAFFVIIPIKKQLEKFETK